MTSPTEAKKPQTEAELLAECQRVAELLDGLHGDPLYKGIGWIHARKYALELVKRLALTTSDLGPVTRDQVFAAIDQCIESSPSDGINAEGVFSERVSDCQSSYIKGLRSARLAVLGLFAAPIDLGPVVEAVEKRHEHWNSGVPCSYLTAYLEANEHRATLLDALRVVTVAKEEETKIKFMWRDDCLEADKKLKAAESALAAMTKERDESRAWVSDLQSGLYVNCVYCGHRYGPGETTPVTMADALKAHIEICKSHPMSALKSELAALKAKRALTEDELATELTGKRVAHSAPVAGHPNGLAVTIDSVAAKRIAKEIIDRLGGGAGT